MFRGRNVNKQEQNSRGGSHFHYWKYKSLSLAGKTSLGLYTPFFFFFLANGWVAVWGVGMKKAVRQDGRLLFALHSFGRLSLRQVGCTIKTNKFIANKIANK